MYDAAGSAVEGRRRSITNDELFGRFSLLCAFASLASIAADRFCLDRYSSGKIAAFATDVAPQTPEIASTD